MITSKTCSNNFINSAHQISSISNIHKSYPLVEAHSYQFIKLTYQVPAYPFIMQSIYWVMWFIQVKSLWLSHNKHQVSGLYFLPRCMANNKYEVLTWINKPSSLYDRRPYTFYNKLMYIYLRKSNYNIHSLLFLWCAYNINHIVLSFSSISLSFLSYILCNEFSKITLSLDADI